MDLNWFPISKPKNERACRVVNSKMQNEVFAHDTYLCHVKRESLRMVYDLLPCSRGVQPIYNSGLLEIYPGERSPSHTKRIEPWTCMMYV